MITELIKAKGVTLISLVITIIILLILAGVTLSLTLGDNGIITQAQKAKEAGEIAAIKEDFQLAILDKELEKGGTGLTQEELEEIAGNYGELQEDGNTIITDDGYEIKIDEIYQEGATGGGSGSSDEEIAALEEKIKELQQTVEDLNNTKTELEGTIEDLNGQLEQEQENNAALQEQIENLTSQVDSLNKTKEQLEATIIDLNTQIASLKEKQATGNATVADVLENKTFSNSSEVGLTGKMPNRGAVTQSLNAGGSYTIPAGYHNGSGKITGKMPNRGAVTQSLNAGGSYTIPAGYHNGSGKITANSLASQTSATATAANILTGKTAWVNGSKITGTMANRGELNWSGSNTTYTVPAGYYSGGTINSKPSYTAGYNAGHSTALNVKVKSLSVTGVSGTASFKDEADEYKTCQYIQASYSITGTVVGVRIDDASGGGVWSYWSREMDRTVTAQWATGYRLCLGATATNTQCKIPLYTSSGLTNHKFNVYVYYVS